MLSEEDRAILDFERGWWREPGPKDQAIEFALGLPAGLYYEHLLRIIEAAEAARYDPLTVARTRRLIEPVPVAEAAG